MYLTTKQIVERMLATHKEITGIELSPSDLGREEVVKLYPFASALSLMYAQIKRVYNARHPGTSDEFALEEHLAAKELPERRSSLPSVGILRFPCEEDGIKLNVGIVATHEKTGYQYVCTSSNDSTGGFVVASFESLLEGQSYNIDKVNDTFNLDSNAPGVESSGINTSVFTGGRDLESPSEMLQRIREANRRENTGGNIPAYEALAKEASEAVVSATGIKHARGVGTVDVIITAGTSDIESAVESGVAVVRVPSADLLSTVQDYVEMYNPTTDDFLAVAPDEEDFDTVVSYELLSPTDKDLVEDLITKAWKKFVYKARSGSRIYVTDIERQIDAVASSYLKHRRVSNFGVNPYFNIPNNSLLSPNQLTLIDMGA